VASKPVAAKAALASEVAKKAIVIESEEVQAAVEQTVEGSADVIVAQAAGAAASSGAAAGGAAAGMSTTALVVAGVAVAAAASSSSSSSTAPAPTATTPTTPATPVAGQTFTLTSGVDALTGTSGNDTFVGADVATDTADTAVTGDTIDGGAGTDTFRFIGADNDAAIVTLTNVETVEITAAAATALNALNWTGVSTIAVNNSGNNGVTTTATTLTNVGSNAALTLNNVAVQNTLDDALSVTYKAGTIGATGTLTLNTSGVGGTDATGGTGVNVGVAVNPGAGVFTSLVINASGTTRMEVDPAAADDMTLASITVTGSGAVVLDVDDALTAVSTIDLSANTGGVTFVDTDLGTGTANLAVTGGSGNDSMSITPTNAVTVDMGAGNDTVTLLAASTTNLVSTDTINLGEGTADVLAMNEDSVQLFDDKSAATVASLGRISGYERLAITDALLAETYDVSAFPVSYVRLDAAAGWTAAAILSGVATGSTIEIRANANEADTLTVNMAAPGGSDDVLTFALNGDITADVAIGSVEIAGVDTVNITTADRNNADGSTTRAIGYTLDFDATATVLSTMNISGASEFTFAGNAASVALATVNAANLTGDLNLNLSSITAGQGVAITGGAGTNTITGSAGDDTIIGGARADSITAGAGIDVMTGGAGADTFTQATGDFTAATAAALAAAADSITDFARGSDLIDWSTDITFVADATATAGNAAVNAEGIASFAAADDTLAERITAVEASINGTAGQSAIFEFGGSTYVFLSDGDAGVDAGDGLIKLVGVTGLTDSTITGGSITIA